jgi:hypothetical protein
MIENLALQRPMRYCKQSACPNRTRNDDGFCDAHKLKNQTTEPNKKLDETAKLYACSKWRNVSRMVREQNYRCQRLYASIQCWSQSRLVHHLISPLDRPELMYDPKNLVALCIKCHGGQAGTPLWEEGVHYVATRFEMPNLGGFSS